MQSLSSSSPPVSSISHFHSSLGRNTDIEHRVTQGFSRVNTGLFPSEHAYAGKQGDHENMRKGPLKTRPVRAAQPQGQGSRCLGWHMFDIQRVTPPAPPGRSWLLPQRKGECDLSSANKTIMASTGPTKQLHHFVKL